MRTRESLIYVGSQVLAKQTQTRKNVSAFDPNPYVVIGINGSMVTARRENQILTRNSSFFKVLHFADDSDEDSFNKNLGEATVEIKDPTSPNIIGLDDQTQNTHPNPTAEPAGGPFGEREEARPRDVKAAHWRRGCPTVQQQRVNDQRQTETFAQRLIANPPTRSSQRLANRLRGGKM